MLSPHAHVATAIVVCKDWIDPGLTIMALSNLRQEAGFQDLKKTLPDVRAAAVILASIGASFTGLLMDRASASETGVTIYPDPESLAAAERAPSWLGPAVLAFPVVTYVLFNYYRENVRISFYLLPKEMAEVKEDVLWVSRLLTAFRSILLLR